MVYTKLERIELLRSYNLPDSLETLHFFDLVVKSDSDIPEITFYFMSDIRVTYYCHGNCVYGVYMFQIISGNEYIINQFYCYSIQESVSVIKRYMYVYSNGFDVYI